MPSLAFINSVAPRAIDRMGRMRRIGPWMLALAVLAIAPSALWSHDSPEHVVEELSAEMDRVGRNAELLGRRATQYRELGRLAQAEADLTAALAASPASLEFANDLARVQLHRRQPTNALATLNRAIAAASAGDAAPLLLTRAEIYAGQGQSAAALADCDRAFAAVATPDLDWYLLRAQLQLRGGQAAAAAEGLKQGFEQTGSGVLEAEWIDALIDAGQSQAALERIEGPLADSRYRGAWLLRRARARMAAGDVTRARGDLHAAVRELDERLQAPHPDATLFVDRGLARALLGDAEAAQRDLSAARSHGVEPSAVWRLESRLAGHP